MNFNLITKFCITLLLAFSVHKSAEAVSLGASCTNNGQVRSSSNSGEGLLTCHSGAWVYPQKSGIGFEKLSRTDVVSCAAGSVGTVAYDRDTQSEVICTAVGWISLSTGDAIAASGSSSVPRYYRFYALDTTFRGTYAAIYTFFGSTSTGVNGHPSASSWTNGTASASTVYADDEMNHGAANARPGDDLYWIAKTDNVGEYWAIDLGDGNTDTIRSIGYAPYSSTTSSQIFRQFAFQASLDGISWDTVATIDGIDTGGNTSDLQTPMAGHDIPNHYYEGSTLVISP